MNGKKTSTQIVMLTAPINMFVHTAMAITVEPTVTLARTAPFNICPNYSHIDINSSVGNMTFSDDFVFRCPLTKLFENWVQELLGHHEDAKSILIDIAHGFRLVTHGTLVCNPECSNYGSALNLATKPLLDERFIKELEAGRFFEQKIKPVKVQSIRAVPKKGCIMPRPITDCSRPFGASLNWLYGY